MMIPSRFDAATPRLKSIQTVTLNPVVLYSEEKVSAELVRHIEVSDWQRLSYSDEMARRHILRMFGKSVTIEMQCPATWWDHVKLVLRARWPQLFERLRIRMRTESASVGAVMAGLPPPTSKTYSIPYMIEPAYRESMTGGTIRDNEEPWQPGEESLAEYVRSVIATRARKGHRFFPAVVVHPADFMEHCRNEELRNYHAHVSDRQSIPTVIGEIRIDIDPNQTRGVVGIP